MNWFLKEEWWVVQKEYFGNLKEDFQISKLKLGITEFISYIYKVIKKSGQWLSNCLENSRV